MYKKKAGPFEEEGIFECASEYTPVSWWELYGAERKWAQLGM